MQIKEAFVAYLMANLDTCQMIAFSASPPQGIFAGSCPPFSFMLIILNIYLLQYDTSVVELFILHIDVRIP